jgi:serine/threonine protein kinase
MRALCLVSFTGQGPRAPLLLTLPAGGTQGEPKALGMTSAASVAPGGQIGPYTIVRRLGAGGMGEVWLAHDPRLGRDVAIKLLASHLGDDPATLARFARETRVVAQLDHPNIVTLFEVGDLRGRPYLVMQYLDGPSLAEFARGRRLSVETVLDLGVQICAGLQAAHERDVIHRDIKPSNILLDSRLRARIVDFGLARTATATLSTATGLLCGTIGYLPPEVVLGEEPDPRSDLFSLGVVLYELLTGRPPFSATSAPSYLYAVVHERADDPAHYRDDTPAGLEAVFERVLAKDRRLRQASAAALAEDLESLAMQPRRSRRSPRQQPSVAVLPFADMSPDQDQEYLCDGLAEELINTLTRIEGLRVIARTSAFAFKGSRTDIREIGQRLGADSILEGSVRKAGPRIRICARLVDARDGSDLWAETYDRELDDIFEIQDEVCMAIAGRLKGTLVAEEAATLVQRRPVSPDAYRLYLRARFLFNQRKAESVRKSAEYYTQAIETDPGFALAHAGLAEAYEMLGSWRVLPPESAYAAARRAATTAVELDDELPEAHATLAWIRMYCDWDWDGAERGFERALSLNPACAEAHHMLAHWNEAMGRLDTAVAEMTASLELEPVAPALHSCLVQVLFHARRYDEAIRESGVTLELAPSFAGMFGWMGVAHALSGRFDVGLETVREGLRQRPGDPRLEALLGTVSALAGRGEESLASLARLDSLRDQRYVDPYFLVWPHAALGEADAAFSWLARARADRSQWFWVLKVDPLLDGLRSDPRYQDELRQLGLAG